MNGKSPKRSGQRVAVVGAGMTKFVRRAQETAKELAWEAAHLALESSR
jgi:acetyl-CoA C-acetyltransferase